MEIPICFGVEGSHLREWVINPDKNLYGLKDAGLAWFDKIREGLEARYFSNHKWTHVYSTRNKCS